MFILFEIERKTMKSLDHDDAHIIGLVDELLSNVTIFKNFRKTCWESLIESIQPGKTWDF